MINDIGAVALCNLTTGSWKAAWRLDPIAPSDEVGRSENLCGVSGTWQ